MKKDLAVTSNLDDALSELNKEHSLSQVLSRSRSLDDAFRKLAWEERLPAPGRLDVRNIHTDNELDEIYRLVHDAYAERGYIEPHPDGRLILYPHLDHIPQTTVLVAVEGGKVVGTNSLTLDGPNGLPSDEDFKKECDAIRREGRPLASSWRLCTRTGFRDERRIVMGLIAKTVRLALECGVRTCVFTINPRHAGVYQSLLNMKLVARKEETVQGLQNAPAVFMRCDFEALPKWCLKA